MNRWISYLRHQERNIMVYFNTAKTYYDIPIHFDTPPTAVKAYLVGNSIRVEAAIKGQSLDPSHASCSHQQMNRPSPLPTAPLTTSLTSERQHSS